MILAWLCLFNLVSAEHKSGIRGLSTVIRASQTPPYP